MIVQDSPEIVFQYAVLSGGGLGGESGSGGEGGEFR